MSMLVVAAAFSGSASPSELSDFATDGCSLFPDGTLRNRDRWFGCCYVHDVRYWQGGTREAREGADSALRACVLEATGDEVLATLMYDGVRVGGHPAFPTWYRWGYGWPYERGYAPLTAGEQGQVARKKEQLCAQLKGSFATGGTIRVARNKEINVRLASQICPDLAAPGPEPTRRADAGRPEAWAKPIPNVPGLPNLNEVTPALFRSAQPSRDGLAYLEGQHPLRPGGRPVKTVLSLRAFHEDESGLATPSSVRYERIRFNTWHPEDEDIVKFLRIATTPALQPVLVHCQHGSDRTGTMVAVYRIAIQGWSKEAAIQEMTQGGYGFHPLWKNLTEYLMNLRVDSLKAELQNQGPWQ
jgi:hypothetical protein